tara:strand:+ start:174 stop:419 length:246 start_codon:yes stop_codon:yes gene_type:complete
MILVVLLSLNISACDDDDEKQDAGVVECEAGVDSAECEVEAGESVEEEVETEEEEAVEEETEEEETEEEEAEEEATEEESE